MGLQIMGAEMCEGLGLAEDTDLLCASDEQLNAAEALRYAGYLARGANQEFFLITVAGKQLLQEWSKQ